MINKEKLQAIVKEYGKPIDVFFKCESYSIFSGGSVNITWGRDINKKIFASYFPHGGVYLVNWTNACPLRVKNLRGGTNYSPVRDRAKALIDKMNKWIDEALNK